MKRIFTFILLLICIQLNAQVHEECGTERKHKLRMQTDPAYKAAFEQNQQQMRMALNSPSARTSATNYKIPVVVHVLHKGTAVGVAENISDEQVYSAIEYMNKAYAHEAPYNQGTQGVDLGVEFCLVQKNPSGLATTGINRVDMSANSDYMTNGITDANELSLKNTILWNKTKYYNIYIVSEIDNNGGLSGVQGYAYFPTSSNYDGAVILYNAFGYDATGANGFNLKSYTNLNITATHEIGHALSLYHTFEGDNNGASCPLNTNCTVDGDEICDTPPHIRSASDCNTTGTNSCTGTSNSLIVHNFMDYSSDACQYEFTAGQATRMQATLTSASSRTSLVNASNITACGCNGDLPVIRFSASNTAPCSGQTVTFTDYTINFPTTWNWTFPGGTPSTSTLQNPTVVYTTGGPYDVSLTVNSAQSGGRTLTKTGYISPQNGVSAPVSQDFTSTTYPPSGWTIKNADASYTWERIATNTSTNYSARINNFDYDASGSIDDIISPMIDLTGQTSASLTFNVAHRYYAGSPDVLRVLVTTDCQGAGGTVVYDKSGTTLQTTTNGSPTVFFTPAFSSEWRLETLNLNAYVGQKIRIIFRNINAYGNNIYLDDFTLTASGGSAPVADFTASLTTVATGVNTVFTNASTGTVSTYSWNFGAGATPATASTAGPHTVTYSTTGSKTVSLLVNGANGSDSQTKTSYITVNTPTDALSASDDASLSVYPNPASTILYLEADASKFDKVEIISMKGEIVMELFVDKVTGGVDISGLAPGVYVARFTGNEFVGARRFTIIR